MKTRVEVNENGEFYIIIPDDIVAECGFDEGELIEWDATDPELVILSIA